MSTFVEPSNEIPETSSLSGKPENTADSGQKTIDSGVESIASRATKDDPRQSRHLGRKKDRLERKKINDAYTSTGLYNVFRTYKRVNPKPFDQMVPFEVEIYGDLQEAGGLTPDQMNRLVQSFCAWRVSFNRYKRKAIYQMMERGY